VFACEDAATVFGNSWEYRYSAAGSQWVKGKDGELPGYRSKLALAPALKLGVFISALEDDTTDDTVWTQTALEMLMPSVTAALWAGPQNRPPPPPSDATSYTGSYAGGVTVSLVPSPFVAGQQMLVTDGPGSPRLNMTRATDADVDGMRVFRVRIADPSTTGCRWLDDGPDREFMYFTVDESGRAQSMWFMGAVLPRTGHEVDTEV
jgi:hypothetical protein